MGKNKCYCGSTLFEKVDITPVGMIEKKFFTRCTQCGLVISGSKYPTEHRKISKCSVLNFVRGAIENPK